MMVMLRRFRRRCEASTATEFALIAPLFLVCVYALFQAGVGIYAHSIVSRVAEQGARHLLFAPDDIQGARQAVFDAMVGTALDPGKMVIAIAQADQPYPRLELRLDYPLTMPGPIPMPQDFPLSTMVTVPIKEN